MLRAILIIAILLGGYLAGAHWGFEAPLRYISFHVHEEANASDIDLACLPDAEIETIRQTRSIELAYRECKNELRVKLGTEFSTYGDDALRAILATIVTARFADYGPSSAITYRDIAAEKYLNCGNTILLAGFLLGQDHAKIRPIGFDGGYVGNHAQLFYIENDDVDDDTDILLDPTYGIIALTSLNGLLSGRSVPEWRIRRFTIKDKTIDSARLKTYEAIKKGRYKPSDFMYLHETVAAMYKSADLNKYFTPAGIFLREKMLMNNKPK